MVSVAGALRLPDLSGPPLTVAEGVRAYDAARVAGGQVPPTWQGDLAQAATSYLFRIFGDTELVARLLPAIAGMGFVALLAFLRPQLGRVGALGP
jgi:predicted membrane-bound mannosyltransferase